MASPRRRFLLNGAKTRRKVALDRRTARISRKT